MNVEDLKNLPPEQIKHLYRQLQKKRGASKHTLFVSVPDEDFWTGDYWQYSLTKRRPWTLKAERRAKAKRAKQARKLNR